MPSSPPFPAVVLAVLCGSTLAPAQATHKDPGHGFSLEVPKRFKRLPVEKDRHCVLAHYISIREYPIKGVRWWGHRPSIRVVHLPKPKSAAVGASKDAASGAPTPSRGLVYADYRDYLVRNLSGKIEFERPDKTEVLGLPCTKLGITRHEQRRGYYLETWIFERGDQTYAVEVMVLEDHREKLWPELSSCLQSFRLAAEAPQPLPKGLSTPLWRKDPARWQKLNAEQRASVRRVFEEKLHEHVKKSLLPGWRLEGTDSCLIVTDSKAKFVNVARVAAEHCGSWLETVFGDITDEQVIKPVIRIFDHRTDYTYYRLRSRDDLHYVEPIHEIVVRSRGQGGDVGDLGDLHSGLLHHYLNNKSAGLARHLPAWMQLGLYQYLRLSRVRGSRWSPSVTSEEKDKIRDVQKRKRLLMPSAIMTQQNLPWREGDTDLNVQRGRLIRFLVDKRKGRKLMPDLLSTYARAVREAQETFPLPLPNLGRGDVEDEDREERDKKHKKLRRGLLKAVNEAVLDLDQKQWKTIDVAWRRYAPR